MGVPDTDFLMHKENLFHKSPPTFLEPFQESVKQVAPTKSFGDFVKLKGIRIIESFRLENTLKVTESNQYVQKKKRV